MNPIPEGLAGEDEGIDLPFDPETDVFWFYVIECEVKGCPAEFYLNDVAISRNIPGEGYYHAQPVNHLMLDGENEISFIVQPGPIPSQALTGDPEKEKKEAEYSMGLLHSVTCHLSRYPYGAVVGGPDRQILLSLSWPQEIHEDPHEYPLRLAASLSRSTGTGPWTFESSPEITLDDATCAEITEFLQKIWDSLEAQDPEPFLAAADVRFEETARAVEDPPYKKRNAFRRSVPEIIGMQPLNPETFDLRLAARGRMVECLQKDWSPILRSKPDPDGNEDNYDMFLARVDGQWAIVR